MVARRVPEIGPLYSGPNMARSEADLGSTDPGRSRNVDLTSWSPNLDREIALKRVILTVTMTSCSLSAATIRQLAAEDVSFTPTQTSMKEVFCLKVWVEGFPL